MLGKCNLWRQAATLEQVSHALPESAVNASVAAR
jgi:hypothetical protein